MTAAAATTSTATAAPPAAAAPKTAAPKEVAKTMFVLDTTAGPDTTDMVGKAVSGARVHQMPIDGVVKPFKFEHGVPLELPVAIAVKFLKIEAFKNVDKDGNFIAYSRAPKQPDELQAGETLNLATNETVARYDELSNAALQQRVLEMPGGEAHAVNPNRKAMIDFIVSAKEAARKKNVVTERRADEFTPPPEYDDEAA